jgi:hypothetical protein
MQYKVEASKGRVNAYDKGNASAEGIGQASEVVLAFYESARFNEE